MKTFEDFKIKKQLKNAVRDLGLLIPTPIQKESYSNILAGSDFVGIAQTGTGKTLAYLLPILQDLKFSDQPHPRVLILVPTRELVIQIVEEVEKLIPFMSIRVTGVYGGSNNINRQKIAVSQGIDIIIGTPRRLYDLALSNTLRLKSIKKLVIDEVDIMLDFGYKTQLKNIFEMLPAKRQNILFSATMTTYVSELMNDFLINPVKKTISISGTPLDTIEQECYAVANFYTKVNLLNYLLKNKDEYSKVLIFVATKANADVLSEILYFSNETSVIHAKKEQNYRTKSIEKFEKGESRILIATDVVSRGIDIEKISTVISFDTPFYPENYIHRIGRTGRAEQKGKAILLHTEKEAPLRKDIEELMDYIIPVIEFPEEVEISNQLSNQEKIDLQEPYERIDEESTLEVKPITQDKLAKNNRVKTEKKSYKKRIKEKYKKPLRRGDKIQNRKSKKKK